MEPCAPWADSGDACAPCDAYDMDTQALEDGIAIASAILNGLLGGRYPGVCTDTIRPQGGCGCRGCGPAGWCGCTRLLSEVQLPGWPVVDVDLVLLDGTELDADRYRVDDGRMLVLLPQDGDARRRWPCCQRLDLPTTERDTWEVSYSYGTEPPAGGARAAASLGCQLALACSTDEDLRGTCQLPKRVTSITRQGVTMAILDPLTLFPDGQTGLADVDLWLASQLLGDRRRPARVFLPTRTQGPRRITFP